MSRQPELAQAPARRCRMVDAACCVCGRRDVDPVTGGRDFEYQTTADEFRIVQCRGCGLVYLDPRPSEEDLGLIYPPDYYSYSYDQTCHPMARIGRAWLDGRSARAWMRDVPAETPRVLDVGCGNGRVLRLFASWGVPRQQLWGTELDSGIVERLRAEGFQARAGRIEAIEDLPRDSFDLIVLLQLIEHVADPRGLVRRLAGLLAPGAALVIETPNADGLDARLFRRHYWGGYHFPRHWTFFTPATLRRLLEEEGLQVVRVRQLPSPVFWVYSLHHMLKYGYRWPGVARFFNPFRNVPLLMLFAAFDVARTAVGLGTSNMRVVARRRA